MKELSDSELDFLEKAEAYRSASTVSSKKKNKPRTLWSMPLLWGVVIGIFPLAATIGILTVSSKIGDMVNTGVTEVLGSNLDFADETLLSIYDSRFLIIGVVWSCYVLLLFLLFLLELFLGKRRKTFENTD